jgi:tripartite-type tricarboxylate transporter receptor subunit TctC
MIAGHVAVMAATILTGIPHVRSGRLRALAVTSAQRTAAAPDIPTVAEAALPGYEAVQWYGVLAPAKTPQDIVARLHADLADVLHQPEVKARFLEDGADAVGNTPDDFKRFIATETVKWAQVAREAGIKPE